MLISEKKDIELKELITSRGHFRADPINDFFSYISDSLEQKDFIRLFRKYYSKNQVGDTTKIGDDKILEFFKFLDNGYEKPVGMRNYLTYDSVSGLAYFIAKKYFNLRTSGFGLEYLKRDNAREKVFFFFDSAFKIFVGKIAIEPMNQKKIKGKVYKVSSAAAERKLIGLGYGAKMYLTILEYCDYLSSDTILFSGSFKIWSKVLPKYVNVWIVDEEKNQISRLLPNEPITKDLKDIDFFVASMYHKRI